MSQAIILIQSTYKICNCYSNPNARLGVMPYVAIHYDHDVSVAIFFTVEKLKVDNFN